MRLLLLLSLCAFAAIPKSTVAQSPKPPTRIFGQTSGLSCRGAGVKKFPGFSVLAFSLSDIGSAVSGASGAIQVGHANFPDVTVTKGFDDCTPLLFGAVANGAHFAEVVLTVVSTGDDMSNLVVKLQSVTLTSDRFTESADNEFVEVVSMVFEKVTVVHISSGTSFSWDVKRGKTF